MGQAWVRGRICTQCTVQIHHNCLHHFCAVRNSPTVVLCSWQHTPGYFAFRSYDEKSRIIEEYGFHTKYVDEIMAAIHAVVTNVLEERKVQPLRAHAQHNLR